MLCHGVFQLDTHFDFRHAGFDNLDDVGKSGVGDALCFGNEGKFLLTLDATHRVDVLTYGHKFVLVQILFKVQVLAHGQLRILETNRGNASTSEDFRNGLVSRSSVGNLHDLYAVGNKRLRHFVVTGVGDEDRLVLRKQQQVPERACKARKVKTILFADD